MYLLYLLLLLCNLMLLCYYW